MFTSRIATLAACCLALAVAVQAVDAGDEALAAAYPVLRGHAVFSSDEIEALRSRGGLAVYLPLGGDDRGLLSELAQSEVLPACRFVDDQALMSGAWKAAALLLPDLGEYAPLSARDEAIKSYLAQGGGIYAVGSAIAHLHELGLFEARIVRFRARGNVVTFLTGMPAFQVGRPSWALGEAGELLARLSAQRALSSFRVHSIRGYMFDGPLFELPPNSPLVVLAHMGINQRPDSSTATLPGLAAGPLGQGRLVILSGGQAGMDSQDRLINAQPLPIEPASVLDDVCNLVRPIVRKQLLRYAAGLAGGGPAQETNLP